ncbi:hypothetical protein [Leisingera sp. NJS204]|uniref:hypothetical protein n=1 Tax=Leisingera sp. NJS204 TaxID=2508307 RepID=UPI001011E2C0|nr:hypothetical protein [Leisingera sp. NJS204]QAX30170.1 hypothetical protein ETW24_12815 [Leisingera sp. NJS204]
MRLWKNSFLAAGAAAALVSPIQAAGEVQALFDTAGFLNACTGFVSNGAFALPMDSQCVTQAVRMCNLSHEMKAQQYCVESTAVWMEEDGDKIIRQMPGFDRSVLESSGAAGLSLPLPELSAEPDCTKMSDPSLTSEILCRYSDALSEWLKLRTMMRSQAMTGAASQ